MSLSRVFARAAESTLSRVGLLACAALLALASAPSLLAAGEPYIVTNSTTTGWPIGPGNTVRTTDDSNSGAPLALIFDTDSGSPGATNQWSAALSLPFDFKVGNQTFNQFCLSKNGLLTFTTSVAGQAVNTNLNDNTVLPHPDMPDNTFCMPWGTFSGVSSGDDIYGGVWGTAPNRHYYVQYWSFKNDAASFTYFSICFEETTNVVYFNSGYNSGAANCTFTIGFQLNQTKYVNSPVPISTGNSNLSPNMNIDTGSSTSASDNTHLKFTPVPGVTWTGALSTDWNTAGNWDGPVPASEDSAIIPSAASVPNTPVLNGDATIAGLILENGASLRIENGSLRLMEGLENQGGAISNGATGRIELAGTADQSVTSGSGNLGRIHISNASGDIIIEDQWTTAQSGALSSASGSRVVLKQLVNDFSNNTGSLEGELVVNLSGIVNVTANANLVLGSLVATAVDPVNDQVVFVGDVGFRDITVSGAGLIGCTGDIVTFRDFNSNMSGEFRAQGDMLGTGSFNYTNAAMVRVDGDFAAGTLNFAPIGGVGVSDLVVAQNATITANGSMTKAGAFTVGGNLTIAGSLQISEGRLSVTGSATITNGLTVTALGEVNAITGILRANSISYSGSVPFVIGTGFGIGAGNPMASVTFSGTGSVTTGSLTVTDFMSNGTGVLTMTGLSTATFTRDSGANATINTLSISNSGSLNGSGNLTTTNFSLSGADFTDASTGNVTLGTVQFSGVSASELTSDDRGGTHVVRVNSIRVVAGEATLEGAYIATSVGTGALAAVRVNNGASLVLGDGLDLQVGNLLPGNVSLHQISVLGAFQSSLDLIDRPALRANGDDRFFVDFGANAIVAINKLRIVGAGAIGNVTPAISIADSATVAAFNNVEITDVQTDGAAIAFNATSYPGEILGLDIFGNAPINIDASNMIAGGDIMVVRRGALELAGTPGSLFGTTRESDPANLVVWENPPALSFMTAATLPNALVNDDYVIQIQASGGNNPLTWSIIGAPDWLSFDTVSGVLSGRPDQTDVGASQFAISIQDASSPVLTLSRSFLLVVDEPVSVGLQIVTTTISAAREEQQYSFNFSAAGGLPPYQWRHVGGVMPLVLSLDEQTGTLSGRPATGTVGTYTIAIRVTDGRGSSLTRTFEMRVNSAFDAGSIPLGDGGQASSCALSGSGTSSLWMVGLLAGAGIASLRRRRQRA